uniref:Very-long-chain (3R)-3-hydroxyacyl-CoA dehydratase n=1 Tax=Poecilia reticulata TaxID=8081 RepID=A0A3P9NPZ7_POERE
MASSEEDGTAEEKENNNKKRTKSALITAWLTFYNIAMTAWLVLTITMMRFYIQKGTHKGLYRSIARTLKFFQTFALVEIVRTSVIVTGVQVCSRIYMVWFITSSIRQKIQNEESVILFLVVWTVTEITRYSYYTFNLLHHLPYFIKWAYNFFIVLYPLGVVGELLTIYAALPFVRRSGMYSMRLPNKYNVSFDYYYFLIIVMLSYIPFPQLYLHMLRQRRRVLHGEVIVEKDD